MAEVKKLDRAAKAIRALAVNYRVVGHEDIDEVSAHLTAPQRWDLVGDLVRDRVLAPRPGGRFTSLVYLGDVDPAEAHTFEGETLDVTPS